MDRRNFLRYGAAAGALFGAARINPDFFFRSAHAQDARPLVFLSAENITGNWDPTAHTTLSQTNIEGFVMGYLTRAPMRPEKPDEVVYELATEITELDAHRLQIKLREGVTFHDGKPFTAEDVKATFEYGALPDRPKQVYPGRYEPAMLVKLIKSEGVTFTHGVPTILQMLLNAAAEIGRASCRERV